MFRILLKIFPAVIFSFLMTASIFAQRSSDNIWQKMDESSIKRPESERLIVPRNYQVFRANLTNLRNVLKNAPAEFSKMERDDETVLSLPMPDGTLSSFTVKDSPLMESQLAARYPQLKTYIAQSIESPAVTARISMTPTGFRAIVFTEYKTVLIDPYAENDASDYISYEKSSVERESNFTCQVGDSFLDLDNKRNVFFDFTAAPSVSNGSTLKTYRLALAATAEYTNFFRQPTDSDIVARFRALEQQVIIMTRVNGIYERDLAMRMILVNNNDTIIYLHADKDPYTNSDGEAMLAQNQKNLDLVIFPPNYEIGHVFSTAGGGIANLNVPCNDTTKAHGVTGLYDPRGDAFAIDYVAHELGHQWGANHTFNGDNGSCTTTHRSSGSAFEPGSGITIMSYAGICSAQNLGTNSIDSFHIKSIESILSFINGTGGNCAAKTAISNSIPTVDPVGGQSFNIPKLTPFALTAVGTDANLGNMTYDWQEYDLGSSTNGVPNTDADGTARPIFRAYPPTASGTRYFPSLKYILDNGNVPPSTFDCGRSTPCMTGESLPSMARTMNFKAIVRDNYAGGGAINTTAVEVRVDGGSGPFQVTSPNSNVSWEKNSTQTVTWNVANTSAAPVAAANVKILLSTNGGQTFDTVLQASTPNDGSQTVVMPNVSTSQARIKVEAVGNIFFDISNTNFSISQSSTPTPTRRLFDFDGDGKADFTVFHPSDGGWYLQNSQSGFSARQFGLSTDKLVAGDYDGDGKTDIAVFRSGAWYWLNSSNGTLGFANFGQSNDIPVAGDFDGDGRNDPTIFRNGLWGILQSSTNQARFVNFGQAGDKPLTGDYDGDGKADTAVFRGGYWYIQRSTSGFYGAQFGFSTDKPIPADYDGDGKTDIAVFRNGEWYLLQSQRGFLGVPFGFSTDIPVAADYDGDGKSDVAVYRNGAWYMLRSQSGFGAYNFGGASDLPIPAQAY